MVPTIVPVYAAVLAFVYIALSARVIQARRSAKVAIGTRGDVRSRTKNAGTCEFSPNIMPFALLLATFGRDARQAEVAHTFALPRACGWPRCSCLASLKSMRTTDYGRSGWRRPSLSLP